MRGYNAFALAVIILFLLLAANLLNAEYWFQFGARSGSDSAFNNGASVQIQTITPQNSSSGSIGFWLGENLDNGAFLQVGYLIENASGSYPSLCTTSGCTNDEYLKAGDAEWFYEYFPPGYNGGFLGAIGPDGSAGLNGTFNTYSFYSIGDTWYFEINGKVVGSANLGTSTSGAEMPVAFGEVANTSSSSNYIRQVIFANLSAYKYGMYFPAATGYNYIGYGVGSKKNIKNPYGVEELGNRVNYFAVGSGLPQQANGTQLWSLGYNVKIVSKYGNINSSTAYIAYATTQISAPSIVYIAPGEREIFEGWSGKGVGSYTGPSNSTSINVDSNITETANWELEYLLNVSSPYSSTYGGGWYKNGSTVNYGLDNSTIYINSSSRLDFLGWSNGNKNISGEIKVNSPYNLNANWQRGYRVHVYSPYGDATGSGWYANNTIITISVMPSSVNISSDERYAFVGWSNGNKNATATVLVNKPLALSAIFQKQYLVSFRGLDHYGNPVNVSSFYVNGNKVVNDVYLNAGEEYNVNYVEYKGVEIRSSYVFNVTSPAPISVPLSVYNVQIRTGDLFNMPVNALADMRFSNGTEAQMYTGDNGNLTIKDVPYGYVNGSVEYLGIAQHFAAYSGNGVELVFFSMLNLYAIISVVAIVATAYFLAKRRFKRSATKNGQVPM
ncbi:MAG: hypothetical protein ACP5FN_03705 [Candidatus Micrarchaeia archaeon]